MHSIKQSPMVKEILSEINESKVHVNSLNRGRICQLSRVSSDDEASHINIFTCDISNGRFVRRSVFGIRWI